MAEAISLPRRKGSKPKTHYAFPHNQLEQNAPPELQDRLLDKMQALQGVSVGSSFAEAGTKALHLDPRYANGPADEAFLVHDEFAHLHLHPEDGALHMTLPEDVIVEVERATWGERHPLAGQTVADPHDEAHGRMLRVPTTDVMIFGPRDEDELEVVWRLVEQSYRFARGEQS